MRTSKVERYREKLKELRSIRSPGKSDPEKEKAVLEVMSALWEAMTLEEREYFNETNHLPWPHPRESGEKK